MPDKFYLTTAIAYVNGVPHIGHALEFIQTDTIARFMRQQGVATHFLTGTDEHGVKIYKTAGELGVSPQELCDMNAEKYKDLRDTFNLSWDDFIRTTERERHWPAVTKLWRKLVENGDLYEKEYEGLYCYGCEEFKRETDLVDGKCPNHDRAPEVVQEKNWFFRLSKYSDQILEKLESRQVAIVPEFRAKEMINIVKDGLHDVSFSRPRSSLPWGIPVPEDDSQVMYVWCDALTNYISAIGYAESDSSVEAGKTPPSPPCVGEMFEKWWPADLHCIGKDIVRFHAGIWIGMLLSVELPLPKAIYVHGFITSEGKKMSKSTGNVVDPVEVVKEWGTDALRYYLLAEIPNGQDGDFSQVRFAEKYNSDLANGLGNLVSRVITMALKDQNKKFKIQNTDESGRIESEKMWVELEKVMQEYDFRRALAAVFDLVEWANKYVDAKKPWGLKDQPEEQQKILATLLEVIRQIALALYPFIPESAEKIGAALGVTPRQAQGEEGDFEELKKWGAVKEFRLTRPKILFPKKEN